MSTHRSLARLAPCVVLLLAWGGVATAQDVADLSGVWTIDEEPDFSGTEYPGTALFYGLADHGATHNYQLALIQHEDGDVIRTTKLVASWDGATLTLRQGATVGLSGSVGGNTATDAGGAATLDLMTPTDERQSKLDLVWLTRSANTLDGVSIPATLRRPTPPGEPDAMPEFNRPVRAPAEWEPAEEIVWGARDAFAVSTIYAGAIKATTHEDVIHRVYVVNHAAEAQVRADFADYGVTAKHLEKVRFHVKNFRSVWMRDYGPLIVKGQRWNAAGTALVDNESGEVVDAEGRTEERIVVDTGYFPDRPEDDSLPTQYAKGRNFLVRNVDSLKFEGGNFLTDGAGRMFTTTITFEHGVNMKGKVNRGQEHIEDRLRDIGGREVFFVERMPEPEGTGHIDMFAKLMDKNTVLIGSCDDHDEFEAVLDRNAERFEQYGYKVIRLPMASGKKLMTYTNSLLVGSTVLIPTYKSSRDEPALQIYRDLGWNAVGIDARIVIKANGAIHCISMQIPR